MGFLFYVGTRTIVQYFYQTNYVKYVIDKIEFEHVTKPLLKQERSGARGGCAGRNQKVRGPDRLRPGLRTGYADDGRTSQGLEHCPSRFLASLFQALLIRGSPIIGVTRS